MAASLFGLVSMVFLIVIAINTYPSIFALIPAFAAGFCFGLAVMGYMLWEE